MERILKKEIPMVFVNLLSSSLVICEIFLFSDCGTRGPCPPPRTEPYEYKSFLHWRREVHVFSNFGQFCSSIWNSKILEICPSGDWWNGDLILQLSKVWNVARKTAYRRIIIRSCVHFIHRSGWTHNQRKPGRKYLLFYIICTIRLVYIWHPVRVYSIW